MNIDGKTEINQLNEHLDFDQICQNYQVKFFYKYSLFVKKRISLIIYFFPSINKD
jgi:hypothetical protein